MIFHQFHLESLGHASYLIGSEQTGEALVLDVRRDVDTYYQLARDKDLRITHAADTHQHNDYLTGITNLEQRGSLELLASARAELGYRARALQDGEHLRLGEVDFEVLHTPGHTPEHISLLVRDLGRGEEPLILLSGGALLVDDVARPDLLGGEEAARQGAQDMSRSLREKILPLPDHVMVFPTHVAGSLCGGSIGSMLFTTLGYERRLNKLLSCIVDEKDFESACLDLDTLPTVPPFWPRMRKQNIQGPTPLGVLAEPPALPPGELERAVQDGAVVVDCRAAEAFGGGHIPGAINVDLSSSFPTWAGSVLPADRPLVLVLERTADLWEACVSLLRVGFELPRGWLAGGMLAWRTAGQPIARVPQWTVEDLIRHRDAPDCLVLDVRQPGEWQAGRVPGAVHIPGASLPGEMDQLPRASTIAVYCGSGYRSSIATSLLKRAGFPEVVNVLGGFSAWQQRQYPVEG